MKDIYDYEFPALAHPTSFPDNDNFENDPYFDDGEEAFGDGVPRPLNTESKAERDPAEIQKLLDIIEDGLSDETLELFGQKRRKKEEAA